MNAHIKLVLDLSKLVKNATEFKYHDFKSQEANPKLALLNDLNDIRGKVKAGDYDDIADESDKAEMRKHLEAEGMDDATIKDLFGL